jgi:hypothetical protein
VREAPCKLWKSKVRFGRGATFPTLFGHVAVAFESDQTADIALRPRSAKERLEGPRRPQRCAREIAASIAAAGKRVAGPWPTTSKVEGSDGSS